LVAYWQTFIADHPDAAGYAALDQDLAQIMAALRWAAQTQRHQAVIALADALNTYWFVHGQWTSGREGHRLELMAAQALGDKRAERWSTHELAVLDAQQGRMAEARAGYERALQLARDLGDRLMEANELRNLGAFIGLHGERDAGRAFIQEGFAISTALEDQQGIGDCHQFLAWLARNAGDRATARAEFAQALAIFEQLGSPDADDVRRDLAALVH
jgi:tetratricopeptide (TPR) repeat protein